MGAFVGVGRLKLPAMRSLTVSVQQLFSAYAQIFIVDDWKFGAVVAALTFIHPNVGLSGLLSLLIALAFGYGLGIRKAYQWNNTYLRNVILIGLSVGYVFRLQWSTLPLLTAVSIGTLLLTITITRVATPLQLPVMSLPFALANIFMSLATLRYDHIYQMTIFHQADAFWGPEAVPELIKGFCFAMAYVVFQSNFWIGAGLALIILAYSRLLFLSMFLSFLLGVSLQFLKSGLWHDAVANPESYNYIFAGTLISTVFLTPSLASIAMGALAVILTVLLYDGLSQSLAMFGARPSAAPFNLVVIGLMQALIYYQSKWRNLFIGRTPEESYERLSARRDRFGYPDHAIDLPFDGSWQVTQGFAGDETHQGPWQYAMDFVKVGTDGQRFEETGLELGHYYGFGAEVLAPCSGYVVAVEKAQEDNLIGGLNETKNWGNFIIIRSDAGCYVSLCHLKRDSLRVKIGDYVSGRQVLAECGNSGYSAQPHLHVQVQLTPYFASPTLPFRIASYLIDGDLKYHSVPPKDAVIQPFKRNRALDYAFVWPSGRRFVFSRVTKEGQTTGEPVAITSAKDPLSGRSYLCDGKDSRLYFWIQESVFYFYDFDGNPKSILAKIFACIPRMPLTYSHALTFTDNYPIELAWRGPYRWILQIGRIFGVKATPKGVYKLDVSGTSVTGTVRFSGKKYASEATLDPIIGIKSLRLGDEVYRQI